MSKVLKKKMDNCCEIVDISQDSPRTEDLFGPDQDLFYTEEQLITSENTLLYTISDSCVLTPEKASLTLGSGFFNPGKGILIPNDKHITQERQTCLQNRVPRPPNAFMLYANENRKNMAHLYPADSNKVISKRLGTEWKTLSPLEKNKYFQRAKTIDSEHKKKYPGYVYNPKEARMRKALRGATIKGTISHQHDQPDYISTGEIISLSLKDQNEDTLNQTNNQNVENMNSTTTNIDQQNFEGTSQFNGCPNIYLPLSGTKFSASPDLFTNNAHYHKVYIAKYFQNIPEYKILNVTTEDGTSFPYVEIPNMRVRSNFLEKDDQKTQQL